MTANPADGIRPHGDEPILSALHRALIAVVVLAGALSFVSAIVLAAWRL